MPVSGFPTSYELTRHEEYRDVRGGNYSSYDFTCLEPDLNAIRAIFLQAAEADEPTLTGVSVHAQMTSVGTSGVMRMKGTAKFEPKWKLDALIPDQPFKWRYRNSSQSFTLRSDLWTWGSGEPVLNTTIKPILSVGLTEVVLFGTRSVFDAATYTDYVDKVNADTFKGAAPGYVMYQQGASANPRQLDTGVEVWDVEIPLICRYVAPWNKFFNEQTGEWEYIQRPDLSYMYGAVPFAPLLLVP